MKFKSVFPYNFKKLIPMLGLAGATLMAPSCSKDDDVPAHDVEIKFTQYTLLESLSEARACLKDNTINIIYMRITDDWTNLSAGAIKDTHTSFKRLFDSAPQGKLRGRGNFEFAPGRVTPSDSTWFANQGWTVNKHIQNQK